MSPNTNELERALASLPSAVEPPAYVNRRVIESVRRQQRGEEVREERPWRLLVAAALIVFAGAAGVIGTFVGSARSVPEEPTLVTRVYDVTDEMIAIIDTVAQHAPEEAERMKTEFERIASEMVVVAAEIDANERGAEARVEMAALLDAQLRIVDRAVAIRLATKSAE
jgi:hypothetical protein